MKCPSCSKSNFPRYKTCQHCDAPLHVSVIKESQAKVLSKTQMDESSSAIGTTVATDSETVKSTADSASESKWDTTAQRSDSVSKSRSAISNPLTLFAFVVLLAIIVWMFMRVENLGKETEALKQADIDATIEAFWAECDDPDFVGACIGRP